MRPFHLKLTAIALLTVCLLLILQRSGRNDSAEKPSTRRETPPVRMPREAGTSFSSPPPQSKDVGWNANERRTVSTVPSPRNHPQRSSAAGTPPAISSSHAWSFPAPGRQDFSSDRPLSDSNPTAAQGIAIQLGKDVRLPSAIFARNNPDADAGAISPALAAATKEIEDGFYREVASGVADKPAHGHTRPDVALVANPDAATDGPSTVILSETDVYSARERADSIYRTLYGDAAANRNGMASAIEARLPVDPGSGNP